MRIIDGRTNYFMVAKVFYSAGSLDKPGSEGYAKSLIRNHQVLERVLLDVSSLAHDLSKELESEANEVYWNWELKSKYPYYSVYVEDHESGPEVYFLPVAAFVAGAVSSGVIGNFAYDILKIIYNIVCNRITRAVKAMGLSENEASKVIDFKVRIQVTGHDYSWYYEFDPEKGIPLDLLESLEKRLESYKKEPTRNKHKKRD